MKIKRLDIYGFKSFPHKVSLPFSQGIIAIVGPNGAGKSNIVDALRWVLGEQNPRRLRVREMKEIIFAGTNGPGPSFAEVRLLLDNEDQKSPKEWRSFPEIEIVRRLYTHGESEYLLNNRPCRLKDIIYLFLDTGAHPKAYGIIDQGQIGKFIEQSPQDRRLFLEELAGISRYKLHREQTSKQLKRTRENLIRLKDILLEVNSRKQELEIQAQEAKKYLTLQEKLRDLQIEKLFLLFAQAIQKKTSLLKKLEEDKQRLKELKKQKKYLIPEEQETQAQRELLKEKLLLEEDKLQKGEKIYKTLSQELEELLAQEREISRILERWKFSLTQKKESLNLLKVRFIENQSSISQLQEELKSLEKEKSSLKEKILSLKKKNKELEEMLSLQKKLFSQKQAQTIRLKERIKNILKQIEKEKKESEKSQQKIKDLEKKKASLKRSFCEQTENLNNLHKDLYLLEKEIERKEIILKEWKTEKQNKEEKIAEINFQIKKWEQEKILLNRYLEEYLFSKTRKILKKYGFNPRIFAEFLDFSSEKNSFIEKALGDLLKAIVVKNKKEALEIAYILKKEKIGGKIYFGSLPPRKFAKDIISKIQEVPSLKEALSSPSKTLTSEGFEVDPRGIISYQGETKTEILNKLKRREELTALLSSIYSQKENLLKELKSVEEKIVQEEKFLFSLQKKQKGLKARKKEIEKQLNTIKWEQEKIVSQRNFWQQIFSQKKQEAENLKKEKSSLERKYRIFSEEEALLRKKVKEIENQEKEYKKELQKLYKQERNIELELSSLQERLKQRKREKKEILHQEVSLKRDLEKLRPKIEKRQRDLSSLKELLSQKKKKLQKEKEEIEILKEKILEKQKLLQKLEGIFFELRQKKEILLQEIAKIKDKIYKKEIDLAEIAITLSHLQEQLWERFHIKIDEKNWKIEKKRSLHFLDSEITVLKKRLKDFQTVNLAAIDELKKIQEREAFLRKQEKDLEKAISDLAQAIKRIDQKSRSLLKEALEKANLKLKEVFPSLFPQGKAYLKFVHSEDPLQAGLELEVKIPGKPIIHLGMLSGGEKALTALGVLCAFYLVKPGPFCVLDEVDAPLDEANIERFINLLKELKKHAQIILVTHNRRVMEEAEVLFGITMEEKGISKIVKVRLD